MSLLIDINVQTRATQLPDSKSIEQWAALAYNAALDAPASDAEVSLLLADDDVVRQLNAEYRGKDYATNVLSFPADIDAIDGIRHLGDIIICPAVVEREAAEQNKPLTAHWAHLVLHGMLHLQGYDHIDKQEAERMETLEIKLLAQLGYKNPYLSP